MLDEHRQNPLVRAPSMSRARLVPFYWDAAAVKENTDLPIGQRRRRPTAWWDLEFDIGVLPGNQLEHAGIGDDAVQEFLPKPVGP